MKKYVFVRKIDYLGRISIPASYRKHLDIKAQDKLELLISGNSIILRKQNLSINYNEILKEIFAIKTNDSHIEHKITNNDILNFEKVIDEFVEQLIDIKKNQ